MTDDRLRLCLLRMAGDDEAEQAFRRFYDLTYERLFRIAMHYLRDADAAQQVVLDVYVTLWERRRTLPAVASIEDYCFILVRNAALNAAAGEARRRALFSEPDGSTGVPPAESDGAVRSPEEQVISDELFARYLKALDRLPEACRRVWIAVREEGMSYQEAAAALGITPKTVDAQLQKATHRLRAALSD